MTALTEDTGRTWRDGNVLRIGVEAASKVYVGAIVELSASGHAKAGTKAASKVYIGVAETGADNTNGSDGDLSIDVRRNVVVNVESAGTRPIPGQTCYLVDDNTVTTVATAASELGMCVGQVDGSTSAVWVSLKN